MEYLEGLKERVYKTTWQQGVLGVVVAALLISAYLSFTKPPPYSLVVAEAQLPMFALIYIAEDQGFFKAENIDVTYRKFTLGRDALADTIAGHSDMATVYETPFVRQVFEGAEIAALTSLHHSTRNAALVTQKSRGIATINDIRGKRIGVTKNTNVEFFLFSFLTSVGIPLTDVEIVYVEPHEMIAKYEAGTYDALALWNPHLYKLQNSIDPADRVVFFSDIYRESSLLAVRSSTLSEKKEAYVGFLRALHQAENYYHAYPDRSKKIVANALPTVTASELEHMWTEFNESMRLDNMLLTLMQQQADWFYENKVYDTPAPNMRQYLYTNYLKLVKPSGVTLF